VKHFIKFLGVLLLIAVVSCDSSDEALPMDTGQRYFPLRANYFQIYEVTETKYRLGIPDTETFELKSVVADSFLNAEGNFTYVIHRSKRSPGAPDFSDLDTWSARLF
jgi:hypothetical protein